MTELRNLVPSGLVRIGGAAAIAGVGAFATLISGCPDPDPMTADAFRAPDAYIAPDAFMAPPSDAYTPPDVFTPPDAYVMPGTDANFPDAFVVPDAFVPPDAYVRVCPPVAARPTVTVRGTINADTTWTCDNTYVIEASGDQGPLYVINDSTLTIEAGTVIRGAVRDGTRSCVMSPAITCTSDTPCSMAVAGDRCGAPRQQGTALVITRGSELVAEGTAEAPIVFTSNNVGSSATPPRAGDWGGLVLLGDAPTNWVPADGAQIEGLPTDEGRGTYGGSDAAGSCGSLSYVRVEYAGYIIGRNNELNGITVGGCGAGTLFDHVQVHLGLDDGIEFFGGSANARYVVVTGTGDDSLDFDLGWTGHVQFFIAQQRDVAGEERCIEGDNHPTNYGLMPYSRPTIYNFTCVGSGTPGTDPQDSIALRRGGQFTFRNGILWNSPDRGFFVQDSADSSGVMTSMDTVAWLRGSAGGAPGTVFENNLVFQIGPDPRTRYFSLRTGSMDATGVEDITAALVAANDEGVDPMFSAAATDFAAPSFAPAAGSAAASGAAALPSTPTGFWTDAPYRGAVRPGATGADLWYTGWTRFSE
ncbi:MAG: hypothetical protein ACK6CU_26220 [Deltaproteobacteria bacterium]|jgi:hypothetical protein